MLISHPLGTTLVHGSAGFIDGALAQTQADIVMLSIADLTSQGRRYASDYWRQVVENTGARRVYVIHHDDYTQPFDRAVSAVSRGDLFHKFVNASRQLAKVFLVRFRKSLDPVFDSQSKAPIADFLMKHQFKRPSAAQVFGTSVAFGVLGEPSRYVCCNSCIETAIRAPKQINTPGRHDPLMPG